MRPLWLCGNAVAPQRHKPYHAMAMLHFITAMPCLNTLCGAVRTRAQANMHALVMLQRASLCAWDLREA